MAAVLLLCDLWYIDMVQSPGIWKVMVKVSEAIESCLLHYVQF